MYIYIYGDWPYSKAVSQPAGRTVIMIIIRRGSKSNNDCERPTINDDNHDANNEKIDVDNDSAYTTSPAGPARRARPAGILIGRPDPKAQ